MIKFQKGFSLIELMIVITIVSILLGIGVPTYRDYVRRSSRTDATTTLMQVAALQERFYLQNGQYASNAQLDQAPPAGLGITGKQSPHSYYRIAITPDAGGLAVGYTAWATVAAGGKQADDADCQIFSLDQNGRRGVNGTFVPADIERCWR